MPEKCRVVVCGYDPMLVRGYVKTGERALWWYLPDELYEDYKVQPGDKVKGTLLAVYNPKAERVATPNEHFTWSTSKETGLAVVLPPEAIVKYELTEFHFLELTISSIERANGREEEVYPGEVKQRKFWPEEKMKLHYYVPYVAP